MNANDEKVEKIMKNKLSYRDSIKEVFEIDEEELVDEILKPINEAPEKERESRKKDLSDVMRKIIYEDVIMDQIESHFRNRD
jgi:hypothetical protein